MGNYREYKTEDFLGDEDFRKWMKSGGHDDSLFLKSFKEQFPGKLNELLQAKAMHNALHQLESVPDAGIKSRIWNNVESIIIDEETHHDSHPSVRPLQRWWWMAAASLILIGGLIWKFEFTYNEIPLVYKKQVIAAVEPLVETGNTLKEEQSVRLKDGTLVKLKPGSKLSHSDFSGKQRIVYLDGEGYFDVVKNPSKPFIVYAGPIVVQVVGTSFNVSSYTGKNKSNVAVRSGKVKVFSTRKLGELENADNDNQAIYLTPNQQVIFDVSTSAFEKGLVAEPAQLVKTGDAKEFFFTNTSVNDILHDLENAYGVKMRYNNNSFATCKVTAPLGDLPLFRKLDIICQTLGATYEVFGTEIVISGGSCDL